MSFEIETKPRVGWPNYYDVEIRINKEPISAPHTISAKDLAHAAQEADRIFLENFPQVRFEPAPRSKPWKPKKKSTE